MSRIRACAQSVRIDARYGRRLLPPRTASSGEQGLGRARKSANHCVTRGQATARVRCVWKLTELISCSCSSEKFVIVTAPFIAYARTWAPSIMHTDCATLSALDSRRLTTSKHNGRADFMLQRIQCKAPDVLWPCSLA
eukprot:COSAG02_NODE_11312_length_1749_cov_1.990303_3_plen_138_part_00